MKINRLLLAFWVVCLALPVMAQQSDAKDILDRTADAFRKAGGMKISFTIRAPEGESKGVIRLKGDKFLIETDGITTWFDGNTQWTYLASSNEVNISSPSPEELQSINPYAWLSLYNQGYSLKLSKTGNVSDANTYKIVMAATKRNQDIQCLILYIEKGSYRPMKLSMVQKGSKDAIVVFINSYQTGENYPDSLFVFDKKSYPTAELIDLR